MTALPGGGQFADQPVDLRLAADVDSAGGLVEQEDARAGCSSSRASATFCWVPPESCADGLRRVAALDPQLADPALRGGLLAAPLIQPRRPKRPSLVSVTLSARERSSIRPSSLRSSLRKPTPSRQRCPRGGAAGRGADDLHLAAGERVEAEDGPQQIRAARADRPARPKISPAPQAQAGPPQPGGAGGGMDLQRRRARLMRGARVKVLHLAADHQGDNVVEAGVGHRAGPDGLAVLEHGEAVGDGAGTPPGNG